jgi:D-alanyl-lipoteichoic acid acyltransferase DltB (MBOAT superfamily)
MNLIFLSRFLHWNYPIGILNIILPIGLSFHTFQSLSYVIEVYRGKQKAERHFGIYALYVMFYPQLVAGPIERPQNLLHQFYEKHVFDYQRVTNGLKLMAWGMFKKVVIADRLSVFVNQAYNHPADYHGISWIAATVFFAFQIFCDFSGYSDIAIGAAQVMGFKLMTNFNRPYSSKSISEFWTRWHISLSTWFRDYLYISLGGNRVSIPRWYFNLFITFLISGLWHGANWTFVIWGALNGFYLIMGIVTQNIRKKAASMLFLLRYPTIHRKLQILFIFMLICFSWIFFRARNLHDALYICVSIYSGVFDILSHWHSIITDREVLSVLIHSLLLGQHKTDLFIPVAAILTMEVVHYFQRNGSIREMLSRRPKWFRWTAYYGLIFAILLGGGFSSSTQFIYFQF